MMPSNHKGFIVLEKAFNIVIKWDELGHVWIHNLRLKEILLLVSAALRPKEYFSSQNLDIGHSVG